MQIIIWTNIKQKQKQNKTIFLDGNAVYAILEPYVNSDRIEKKKKKSQKLKHKLKR